MNNINQDLLEALQNLSVAYAGVVRAYCGASRDEPDNYLYDAQIAIAKAEQSMKATNQNARDRLTVSAMAIIHLHEIGQLSEGQAMKLMNSPDIVSYRLTRERLTGEMRNTLREDAERHGWKL